MPDPASASTNLPPRSPVPAVAQGMQWATRPYEFLRETAHLLGDAFTLDLGRSGLFVMFSHPSAIREIFTADPAILHAGKGNEILRPFLGSGSLLLLEEEEHQRERRVLVPAFHAKRIEEHGEAVRQATLRTTASWSAGERRVIQNEMQLISIDVILRVVFGPTEGGERREDLRAELLAFLNDPKCNLGVIGQLRQDFAPQEVWAAFRRRFSRIDSLIRAEVRSRRERGLEPAEGMMGLLLASAGGEDTQPSEDRLRDEILTLVVAGYETTATALAWALYWIQCTDLVHTRLSHLREELGADPSPSALAHHSYLDALCKEVLRIHPVIPVVARQAQRPFEVTGFQIPAGVTVAPCSYLAHHRPEAFPDPDVFRPERFLGPTPSPYEYLPFGGGARRCVGMGLALLEMKIVLGTLLTRFDFERLDAKDVRPVRRSVTVAPSTGPLVGIRRRM